MSRRIAAGLPALLGLLVAGLAAAAPPPAAPPAPARPLGPSAPVRFDGRVLFTLHGYQGAFDAEDRAEAAEEKILRIAQDPFYSQGLLTIEKWERGVAILYRGQMVGLITDQVAEAEGQSAEDMAASVVQIVEAAVERYRREHTPHEWQRAGLFLALATLVLIAAVAGLGWLLRRLAARLEARREAGLTLRGRHLRQADKARLAAFERRVLQLLRTAVVALLLLVYLQTAFALLPLTRSYALAVLEYLLDPLRTLWQSFLANVGDFFFVFVMLVLTWGVLKLLRWLFSEAMRGTISILGIPRDRAMPLYKILRLVVIAVAAVMIYPYIPGSSSAAFKGISLFAGALFTLGASGTASNFIGGIVLIFMDAFRVGDRVRVGEVTGDVIEVNLMLTRLRTPKNEIVTVANSTVLSGQLVNYSAKAREGRLILHTTVSIGYDTPWRKVHELLIQAASKTDGVADEPAPFVLQTSLGDFYVSYEINAYTNRANRMAQVYGELHQNIQDAFNEAGVEILSPHFTSLRDGNASTVPQAAAPPLRAAQRDG